MFKRKIAVSFVMLLLAMSSANARDFRLDNCEEDYEDVNFCGDEYKSEYQAALEKYQRDATGAFNQHYVLHFIKTQGGFSDVVAIDTTSDWVIPLGLEIKATGKVLFSAESDEFCFAGDVEGYRQADTYTKACYRLESDEFSTQGSRLHFSQTVMEH